MGWIMCPPNSYVEVLIPCTSNVTVLEDRAFKEVINYNEVIWMGPNSIWQMSLEEEQIRTQVQKENMEKIIMYKSRRGDKV